ncbi:MAG: hypothetical protein H0W62_12605 [Chitinophagales bacterium]|nr:hypothetical protein [Chitinophagales bacterium]
MNAAIDAKKIVQAIVICYLVVLTSAISFAQENPLPTPPATPTLDKQDSWQSFTLELKDKYQKISNEVADIRKQATEKKIDSPSLNDALSDFDEAAKNFEQQIGQESSITADRRSSFKSDVSNQWDKVNTAYNKVREEWDKVNK